MTQQSIDAISIIGAGVTGIACAQHMRKNGYKGKISIFDKSGSSGGRLISKKSIDGNFVYEMGAGRFHEKQHPQVNALCREFNLAVSPFSYQAVYSQIGSRCSENVNSRQMLEDILELAPLYIGKNKPFHEFCVGNFGEDVLEALTLQSGYNTLKHPKLPVEGGIGILCHHPETHSLFKGNMDGWFYIKDGFQQLPNKLYEQVRGNVDIQLNTNLHKVEDDHTGGYSLILEKNGQQTRLHADSVIMATPLQDIGKVEGVNNITRSPLCLDMQSVPLVKGFIKFDRAWWNDFGYSNQCVIGDSIIRKLYLSDRHNLAWFYCDGDSAITLGKILEAGDNLTAFALIMDHLGVRATPEIKEYQWKFWERGISFDAKNNAIKDFAEIAPNFLVCSDVLTENLGWIEGGLTSGRAAAVHLCKKWSQHQMEISI